MEGLSLPLYDVEADTQRKFKYFLSYPPAISGSEVKVRGASRSLLAAAPWAIFVSMLNILAGNIQRPGSLVVVCAFSKFVLNRKCRTNDDNRETVTGLKVYCSSCLLISIHYFLTTRCLLSKPTEIPKLNVISKMIFMP